MTKGMRDSSPAREPATVAQERRAHRRFLEQIKVRYRDLEGLDPSSWGRTRDLSLGGLCLISERGVRVGGHLALEIHIESEPAPVLALGRVLRCEEDDRGGVAGIQFLWVSEEDRSNLERLAEYFRRKHGETGEMRPES
ncbi:MAG: PilZ domain-containing protein [Planctomycetota bacterium]